jgi:hypothetical protein
MIDFEKSEKRTWISEKLRAAMRTDNLPEERDENRLLYYMG